MTSRATAIAIAMRIGQARARAAKHLAASTAGLLLLVQPAAAQADAGPCAEDPDAFRQLFQLLVELERLGIALGLSVAALGYITAGIFYMLPGAENDLRAKRVFIGTTVGLVLVLMAEGFVQFIQDVLCSGG